MNLKHFFEVKSSKQGKLFCHHSCIKTNICNKLFWNNQQIFYSEKISSQVIFGK